MTNLIDLLARLAPDPPARQRIFGVGAAKTGTHSLGEMFADRVRSAHECDAGRLIRLHLRRIEIGDAAPLRRFLRLRDWRRRLRIDASQVNIYLIDDLEAVFPGGRYVLTVRPPLEWLRSIIDDSLRRPTSETWLRFRAYRFGVDGPFPAAEAELERRGLHQLRGYLGYWRDSIERVTSRVPPERLLIVPTRELGPRSAEIAAFCGVEGGAAAERAHSFANPERFHVLEALPAEYLRDVVEAECGAISWRIFGDGAEGSGARA